VLVRQQAGSWLPALALTVWFAGRRDRLSLRLWRLAALGLAFALPLAAACAVFAARGAVRELVFWTVIHNLRYAANPIPLTEAVERAASYLLPWLLATAPLWWAAWRSLPLLETRHSRVLLSSLVVFSLPAVFVGFRFFPHYFVPLYLPLALGAAPWTAAAVRGPTRGAACFALAWPFALLVAFTVANLVLYYGPGHVYEETRPVFRRVAARLRADPCDGAGSLFVWGFAPQLYAEADLPLASRFVVPQASLVGYVPGNRASRAETADPRGLVREEDWDRRATSKAGRRPPRPRCPRPGSGRRPSPSGRTTS
jgi:4-amino-4-deoxy-L-arabinose transferase-like glycosyltransferase